MLLLVAAATLLSATGDPFCTDRASCNNHGNCINAQQCDCDPGWVGPHCGSAECKTTCYHGGKCNAAGTACEGCEGAWSGVQCDVWNSSYPAPSLASAGC
jgi:hypothetical protein